VDSISVAIVEDHAPMRDALAAMIAGADGYRLAGAFESMEAALAALAPGRADVVLADIELPGMSGIDGIRELKASPRSPQILMLTVFADNAHVFEAICAGASGYLLKDTPKPKLLAAIREVHEGGAPMSPSVARRVVTMFQRVAPPRATGTRLSEREIAVLQALADGHAYKTAADKLGISTDTIRSHVRNIYDKLHVHSKSEAVQQAFRQGILR
jgi:DNA-binding NarL/FixJ family response regulator